MGLMRTRRGAGRSGRDGSSATGERLRLRPWADPRLVIGVLLVLAATVLGARVVAAADDTARYWALAHDVRAGDTVSTDDLVAVDVQLSGATGAQHLAVADELPAVLADLQWSADATAGALVARDDLTSRDDADSRQLPVHVAAGSAPTDLRRGDRVDVWVGPGPDDPDGGAATRVLTDVVVLGAGGGDDALDSGSARDVLLRVPTDQVVGEVVSAVASGHVTLVRLP